MAQPLLMFLGLLLFWFTQLVAQSEFKRQVVDLEAEDGKKLWALLYTNSTSNPSIGVINIQPKDAWFDCPETKRVRLPLCSSLTSDQYNRAVR